MFSGRLGVESYDQLSLGLVDSLTLSAAQLLDLDTSSGDWSGRSTPRRGNLPAPPLPLPPLPDPPPAPIYAYVAAGPSVTVLAGPYRAFPLTREVQQVSFSQGQVALSAGTFEASIDDWRDGFIDDEVSIPLILSLL